VQERGSLGPARKGGFSPGSTNKTRDPLRLGRQKVRPGSRKKAVTPAARTVGPECLNRLQKREAHRLNLEKTPFPHGDAGRVMGGGKVPEQGAVGSVGKNIRRTDHERP